LHDLLYSINELLDQLPAALEGPETEDAGLAQKAGPKASLASGPAAGNGKGA